MFKHIAAFVNGVREFRSDFTTGYDHSLIDSYDWGREIAHRATFRRFERY